MKQIGALVASLLVAGSAWGNTEGGAAAKFLNGTGTGETAVPMGASAQTLASRGLVTPTQTLYGGFTLNQSATLYILVRGNSMGTLGVTQNFLDAPRVRLFNQANQDVVQDASGNAGFNGCTSTGQFTSLVFNYYQGRGAAAQSRDACVAIQLNAGVYTFTVDRSTGVSGVVSSPSSGEILFEVTLGP